MGQTNRIVVVGSANMDIVLPVDRLPRAGETIAGGDLVMSPGGKGANQACAAAKLGGAVSLIARVGSDPFGETLLSSLQRAGVNTDGVGTAMGPSGCASIFVLPGGENSIVISPGANAALSPAAALAHLDALGSADYILVQLEIPIETVEAVLGWSRSHKVTTILDPAPARLLSQSLLRNVDYLTPNQSEAAALLGNPSWEIKEFAEAEVAAEGLLALGASSVVMKMGALGCLASSRQMRARVQGFHVDAVDVTAAGDAFNGALAVALTENAQLLDAAAFANAAAAISVTRRGTQNSLPNREDVNRFLRHSQI